MTELSSDHKRALGNVLLDLEAGMRVLGLADTRVFIDDPEEN